MSPLVKANVRTIEGPPIKVECLFNPKEYQIKRSNSWSPTQNPTKDNNDLTFSGSSGATLSLQLFFDTYLHRASASADPEDVRKYTDVLWKMMNINRDALMDKKSKRGRPPKVLFTWGKTWLFEAVITSMEQNYTMFTPSGMPVRAMVTVEFQEARETTSVTGQGGGMEYRAAAAKAEAAGDDARDSSGRGG